MSPALLNTWSGSLHQTFRLLPLDQQSKNILPFLEADGKTPEEVLASLPYDRARSSGQTTGPDPKRYRDGKQVYQSVGLLYEADGIVHVSELGQAVRRWTRMITPKNRVILARHAAYALSACQLRNGTGAGERYDEGIEVFPFSFIWRAMLALDNRLSSDELNRCLFKVTNEGELSAAISAIRAARAANDIETLGPEIVSGRAKNDRILPWMSLASFGWTLFPDKRGGDDGNYELPADTLPIIREAASIRHRHRDFASPQAYVLHVSRCAALPKDLR